MLAQARGSAYRAALYLAELFSLLRTYSPDMVFVVFTARSSLYGSSAFLRRVLDTLSHHALCCPQTRACRCRASVIISRRLGPLAIGIVLATHRGASSAHRRLRSTRKGGHMRKSLRCIRAPGGRRSWRRTEEDGRTSFLSRGSGCRLRFTRERAARILALRGNSSGSGRRRQARAKGLLRARCALAMPDVHVHEKRLPARSYHLALSLPLSHNAQHRFSDAGGWLSREGSALGVEQIGGMACALCCACASVTRFQRNGVSLWASPDQATIAVMASEASRPTHRRAWCVFAIFHRAL